MLKALDKQMLLQLWSIYSRFKLLWTLNDFYIEFEEIITHRSSDICSDLWKLWHVRTQKSGFCESSIDPYTLTSLWGHVTIFSDKTTFKMAADRMIQFKDHERYRPIPRSRLWPKKWEISLLNGYSSWCKLAINKFLIDNSASCWSQDIQVFEN